MLRSLSISEYVEEFAHLFPMSICGGRYTRENFLGLEKQAGSPEKPYVEVSLTDHVLYLIEGLPLNIWERPWKDPTKLEDARKAWEGGNKERVVYLLREFYHREVGETLFWMIEDWEWEGEDWKGRPFSEVLSLAGETDLYALLDFDRAEVEPWY